MRNHDALIAFLGERLSAPFAWRDNDCCSFAFEAVRVQTGHDAWAEERDRYSTAKTAAQVIRRYGSIEAIADSRFERTEPGLAQRGDIALVPSGRAEGETTLAIFEGATIVAVGEANLVRLPRRIALAAWDIERPLIKADA